MWWVACLHLQRARRIGFICDVKIEDTRDPTTAVKNMGNLHIRMERAGEEYEETPGGGKPIMSGPSPQTRGFCIENPQSERRDR